MGTQKVNEDIPGWKEEDFINRKKMSGNFKISCPSVISAAKKCGSCLDKANKITGAWTMKREDFLTLNVVIDFMSNEPSLWGKKKPLLKIVVSSSPKGVCLSITEAVTDVEGKPNFADSVRGMVMHIQGDNSDILGYWIDKWWQNCKLRMTLPEYSFCWLFIYILTNKWLSQK